MDMQEFDAFVRAMARGASRRVVVTGLVGGALAALASSAAEVGAAKKKKGRKGRKKKKKSSACKSNQTKCGRACCAASQTCIAGKCLGACQFTIVDEDAARTMTLQRDCAATETIVIPDGFTLEGGGKTIRMAGPVTGYQSVTVAQVAVRAGVLIQNGRGSVKNVTIDQDGLACEEGQAHSAIAMPGGAGDIASVEIVVTRDDVECYRGIDAETVGNVNVRGVTITGGRNVAMAMSGPMPPDGQSLVAGEISDCTITNAEFGMVVNASRQKIRRNAVEAKFGILVGVFPSDVTIESNTLTGLSRATNPAGILYNPNTKGTVSNNSTAGFSCGISIQTNPGDVFLSGNTFPEPRNASDLCFPTP